MIRWRKILGIKIEDIWFNKRAFIESCSQLTIFHTQEKIQDKSLIIIKGKTFFIDLRLSLVEIFSAFDKKSVRYAIKKAERDGILIKKAVTSGEFSEFYNFFKKFAAVKRIPLPLKEECYEYDIFYATTKEEEYLGGCAFIKAADKSIYRYKHGATSHQKNANNLLLWRAIQHAKEAGYVIFDLGGVKETGNLSDRNYWHYKFKEGFGGFLVDFYSYLKIKKPFIYFFWPLIFVIHLFFRDDYNLAVNFLHKIKILKSD